VPTMHHDCASRIGWSAAACCRDRGAALSIAVDPRERGGEGVTPGVLAREIRKMLIAYAGAHAEVPAISGEDLSSSRPVDARLLDIAAPLL
jgi:hypothetical protein